MKVEKTHIAVIGMGYVGCVSAACLAELGHQVTGIESDPNKVESILLGNAPFYEPGLPELVRANVAAGRLHATTEIAAIREVDVVLICVGTPSAGNGNLGLTQLRRVIEQIANECKGRDKGLVVAVRSTVFPGTCEDVVIPQFDGNPMVEVVSNPEFLREGTAIRDFMEPSLIVVGGDDAASVEKLAGIYSSLPMEVKKVQLRTAEMIKYACNAFHAVKIAFANEIGSLSAKLDLDAGEVMSTLCADTKLNISSAYLRPGFAFGGSCLPKDLRALMYRANRMDICLPLLGAALPSNNEQLGRAVQAVLDLPSERIGVIGLAFKENTDDLRESPVVSMLETLIGKGRNVRVYDPHIQMDLIYGSNKNFVVNQIPHIGRLMDRTIEDTLGWADYVVIAQNLSKTLAEKVRNSGLPVVNLVESSLVYLNEASRPYSQAAAYVGAASPGMRRDG